MIGLDTNVLVLFIVRDDPHWIGLSNLEAKADATFTFDVKAAESDLFERVGY